MDQWTIVFSPLFIQMTVSLDTGIQMRCGKMMNKCHNLTQKTVQSPFCCKLSLFIETAKYQEPCTHRHISIEVVFSVK